MVWFIPLVTLAALCWRLTASCSLLQLVSYRGVAKSSCLQLECGRLQVHITPMIPVVMSQSQSGWWLTYSLRYRYKWLQFYWHLKYRCKFDLRKLHPNYKYIDNFHFDKELSSSRFHIWCDTETRKKTSRYRYRYRTYRTLGTGTGSKLHPNTEFCNWQQIACSHMQL